jgi:hypothetical protein
VQTIGGVAMNISDPVFVWQHHDAVGHTIGEIRRFVDNQGRKKDIPFYNEDSGKFKSGIPENLKRNGYTLFGLETYRDKEVPLIISEGQKAQQAFAGIGFQCVTSILGAANAHHSDWQAIKDAKLIYIVPDNDVAGEVYAKTIHKILQKPELKIIRLPDLPEKGDVCDWLKQQPEYDSLLNHPAKEILRDRLVQIISENLHELKESTIQVDIEWPDPEPIQNNLLPVESLRSCLIPEAYRDWITDIAERMQCPPDFVAVAAIVVTAAIVGAGCGIKPKQKDDWLVIPNLWGGIIGRPGMLKTPAVSEVMQLLSQFESEAKKSHENSLAEYNAEVEIYKAGKEALKSAMLNSQKQVLKNKFGEMTDDPITLKKQFINLKEPEKPIWKRFKTNDATIEKLSELLADNPHGLLLYRDELIGLLAAWDKEGRESDRAFFLEAWNGCGSLTTDRIGRGTVHTENLCLSIFGNTQPAKLIQYLDKAIRGADNDGLLQRFQLLIYPDETRNWKLIDRVPNHRAKQRAIQTLNKLTDMDFTQCGAIKEVSDRFAYFRFDDESQELFYCWLTELEREKLVADDQPIILEHLSKYRSLMPSLALVFHLIELADSSVSKKISVTATACAIGWCNYLESHARRIYGMAANIANEAAAKLAKKIQEGQLPNCFSLRDVYRKHWGLLDNKDTIQNACDELIEAGWLRLSNEAQAFGRPRSLLYHVSPKIKVKEVADENPP